MTIIELVGVFLAGLLAGGELVVRYGVQPALDRLVGAESIRARQALIHRLRVYTPVIMVPTVGLAVAVVIMDGSVLRVVGLGALVAFVLLAFLGTVPINIRVAEWDAEDPPADGSNVIRRWALIDVFRSAAAVVAFACLLTAAVQVRSNGL